MVLVIHIVEDGLNEIEDCSWVIQLKYVTCARWPKPPIHVCRW